MLTHSKRISYNIRMNAEHFEEGYHTVGITPFRYDPRNPSYFSAVILLKQSDYFDERISRVSGRLTPEGLAFVQEERKKGVEPMYWRDYLNRFGL